MNELIAPLLAGPVLPVTALLGVLIVWSLLAILGGVDLHFNHGHFDLGDVRAPSAFDALGGLSATTLKWLNLREIPVIVWFGIFTFSFWLSSAGLWIFLDSRWFEPSSLGWSSLLIVRNVAIGLAITKLVTQPMRGLLRAEQLTSKSLVGQECEISSLEASPEFGQVKFKTDGSPLLLNVRTDGPHLAKGACVWITHYDEKRRLYIVSPTTPFTSSLSHSSTSEQG